MTNSGSNPNFIGFTRAKYSYAPYWANSVLEKIIDPDQKRWIGPIISIGKSGQTIEVLTSMELDAKKTYEVVSPAWSSDQPYKKRVIASAVFKSSEKKIVLQIRDYSQGYTINSIVEGMDVYEKASASN